MGLEGLTEIQILRGTISIVFVTIQILIGLRLLTKYFSAKKKEFITIGITWIFLSSAWWGGAFSFLSYLLFNYAFSVELYLFLGNFFIPLALIAWIYTFTNLAYPEKKKQIFYPYLTVSLIYEIVFLFLLFTNIDLVGGLEDRFNSRHSELVLIFLLFALISTLISGVLFARQSIKSNDSSIKLKGNFLLFAFVIFIIGALFDAIAPAIPWVLIVIKVVLVISGILYYFGFFLPSWIEKKLIEEQSRS